MCNQSKLTARRQVQVTSRPGCFKAHDVQLASASVIQQSSLCVSVTYSICSVCLFTVVCQRKIGNKKEWEKEKTRKQTYQRHIRVKVDHVTDCPHYITSGIHTVCAMVWLGVKHAESALEGADCPHYEWQSLRMLRSRGENSVWGGSFHQCPRSTCHAAAEVEQWLCSQMDQMEGIKTGDPLSSSFPIRSSARFLISEARPAVLPPRERAQRSACPFPRRETGRMSMNFHKTFVHLHKHVVNK